MDCGRKPEQPHGLIEKDANPRQKETAQKILAEMHVGRYFFKYLENVMQLIFVPLKTFLKKIPTIESVNTTVVSPGCACSAA